MAMSPSAPVEVPRLGCGRTADRVWAQLSQAPDAHEQKCAHCQTARNQLRGLAELTEQARQGELSQASAQPSKKLTAQIMQLAQTEIRRGRLLPLEVDDDPRPSLAISDIAVMAVVRGAADTVSGVRARRCVISSPPDSTSVSIEVQVTVAAGVAILPVTSQLRKLIAAAVHDRIGVAVARINITVGDLYEP